MTAQTAEQTAEQGVREFVEFEAKSARAVGMRTLEAFALDTQTMGIRHALGWHAEDAVRAEWLAKFWTEMQTQLERATLIDEVEKVLTTARDTALRTLTDGTEHTNQITTGAGASERQAAARALELVTVLIGRLAS